MKNIISVISTVCLLGLISVNCSLISDTNTLSRRDSATCGDASAATIFYEAIQPSPPGASHGFGTMAEFVDDQALPNGHFWTINRPSFEAWLSPGQPSTAPLYVYGNPTTTDTLYLVSTDGNIPTPPPGFQFVRLVCYVYATQICGSVPLYVAAGPGDHWYTTSLKEHNELVNRLGWTDAGIVAYVLPLSDCSCNL